MIRNQMIVFEAIYIPQALHMQTCINHFSRHAGCSVLFCGLAQESVLATCNAAKKWAEDLKENEV